MLSCHLCIAPWQISLLFCSFLPFSLRLVMLDIHFWFIKTGFFYSRPGGPHCCPILFYLLIDWPARVHASRL